MCLNLSIVKWAILPSLPLAFLYTKQTPAIKKVAAFISSEVLFLHCRAVFSVAIGEGQTVFRRLMDTHKEC